jgi:hypothetical protein
MPAAVTVRHGEVGPVAGLDWLPAEIELPHAGVEQERPLDPVVEVLRKPPNLRFFRGAPVEVLLRDECAGHQQAGVDRCELDGVERFVRGGFRKVEVAFSPAVAAEEW